MKAIAELLGHREPNAEEAQRLRFVVEVAHAWRVGELDLAGVRSSCTGYERWQAMSFAPPGGEDMALLRELAAALVATDHSGFSSNQGWISYAAEVYGQAVAMTNAAGRRVWVWPMFSINGDPVYPLVELPMDSKRLERQHAATMAYAEYRRKKRGGG